MTHFEFQPSKRKGRNRYVGKWTETPCRRIDLPFTNESLRQVLAWGAAPDSAPYNHQDIAHWCDALCHTIRSVDENQDRPTASRHAIHIAEDVDAQWSLFLANTFYFEKLKEMNHGEVLLPADWFQRWLKDLEMNE